MKVISHFQIRGVPGQVVRSDFDGRIVDFWSPTNPSHLLIAHDGQNVFDPRTATRRRTWKMAQNSSKVFDEFGYKPPAIIGIFHSASKRDQFGRIKDLTPQQLFQGAVTPKVKTDLKPEHLRGDEYQKMIAELIVPEILKFLDFSPTFEKTAMIGSSMGGLATLNALTLRSDFFKTALAFSPHWVIGGKELVEQMLNQLPQPGTHKIWMSRGDRKLDSTYKEDQDHADLIMRNQGWSKHYRSTVFSNAGHNEKAWSKQLSKAFEFWLLD